MAKLISVEIRMPKGAAQMADPWRIFDMPGIKRGSIEAGFGRCDYLYLTGTSAKAIMAAARAAGATERDLMEAMLND